MLPFLPAPAVSPAQNHRAGRIVAGIVLTLVLALSAAVSIGGRGGSSSRAVLTNAGASLQATVALDASSEALERMKASRDAQELYIRMVSSMLNETASAQGNTSSLAALLRQLQASAGSRGSLSDTAYAVQRMLSSLNAGQRSSSLTTQDYLSNLEKILSSMRSQESLVSTASSVSVVTSSSRTSSRRSSSARSQTASPVSSSTPAVTSSSVGTVSSVTSSTHSLSDDEERALLIELLQEMIRLSNESNSSVVSTVSSQGAVSSSVSARASFSEYVAWMKNVAASGVQWKPAEAQQIEEVLARMSPVQSELARKLTMSLTLQEPVAHRILSYVVQELPRLQVSSQTADSIFAGFKIQNGLLLVQRGSVQNPDVDPRDWYAPAVVYAQKLGLMKGQGNGLFAPEQTLNQAELAVMLASARGRSAVHPAAPSGSFNTWPGWGKDAIASLRAQGVNVLFFTANPATPVTRLQMARAIAETLLVGRVPDPAQMRYFPDTRSLPPDLSRTVNIVSSLGIMTGRAGGTLFDPYGLVNRAEAAQIFVKAVDARTAQNTLTK